VAAKDGLFEKIGVLPILEADSSLERLVGTMLGPGLGDCFQFDIGGLAIELLKVLLNRPHFLGTQRQLVPGG
jgi:hypothetical protein